MLDPVQILLTVVISVLTIILSVIGVQIYRVLEELRKALKKINKITENAETVTGALSRPFNESYDFIVGLKKGIAFFKAVSKMFEHEKNEQ